MGVQTHLLTYGKQPYEKEFLDFSFNGKYISEFGLVAVFDGDRLSMNGSPDFQDEVTSVEGVPGQYFWGTKFKTIKRNFTLVTDGMTEKQLNSFKKHFCPGYYGKFIEDQYACRYSYCRIAAVTTFSIVPFREPTTIKLNDKISHTFYTNLYKGEVKLTLEWDNPFYYSIKKYIEDVNLEEGKEPSANLMRVIEESFRAAYINNLVFSSSWAGKFYMKDTSALGQAILGLMRLGVDDENGTVLLTCHLGGNKKLVYSQDATGEWVSHFEDDFGLINGQGDVNIDTPLIDEPEAQIAAEYGIALTYDGVFPGSGGDNTQEGEGESGGNTEGGGSGSSTPDKDGNLGGDNENSGEGGNTDTEQPSEPDKPQGKYQGIMLYYNPSTADSLSKITLRFTPRFTAPVQERGSWKPIYLDNIADSYNIKNTKNIIPYNSIKATDILLPERQLDDGTGAYAYKESSIMDFKYQFHYTTPGIISQVHATIALAEKYVNNAINSFTTQIPVTQFEDELRKEITNDKVLKWAIGILSHMRKSDLNFFDEDTNTFIYTQTNNVYAPTITKTNTGVAANWLGYFNILMLCLFVPNINNNMDITCDDTTTIDPPTNWDWNNIGEMTIVFDGINSVSKIDYICNTITNNLEITKKEVKEEVCGDMILSPYLKLGGGNTIDNSGLIESCHCLCFERSGRRIGEEMNYVKLEYEYVYL